MFGLKTLLLASGLGLGFAAPTSGDSPFPAYRISRRDAASYNASLPNVTIFATGGTIAGTGETEYDTTTYTAGEIPIEDLVDEVPRIREVANVRALQFANIGSGAVDSEFLADMAREVQKELDDPYCQGAVVTHGTNTLEESAFFLDLTVRTEKPVVFVGAMRPATAMSADGPINLLAAVTLAAAEEAKGRGTMIALNDRIGSAWFTGKMHANSLDTFLAPEQGFLGFFLNIQPVFFYAPALPLGRHYFNASQLPEELPQVDILYAHQALNPTLAGAAVETGAKGLVLAGSGAGGWTSEGSEEIDALIEENDIQVVTATQNSMGGFVTTGDDENRYGAWHLTPRKARILLQLALAMGYGSEQIESLFWFTHSHLDV